MNALIVGGILLSILFAFFAYLILQANKEAKKGNFEAVKDKKFKFF